MARTTLKHFFIPHAENNYHPHILHTKRTLLYGGVCLAMKGIMFLFVLLLPSRVFLLPDVLNVERQKIIQMTNELRAASLVEQPLLDHSAELKTRDMVVNNYFDHTGPGSRNLQYFLNQVKYPYEVAGENLAMGFSTAEDVMRAWQKSPSHNANLLDTDFSDIGVGIEAGEYNGVPTVYMTQHFGRPKITPPQTVLSATLKTNQPTEASPPATQELSPTESEPIIGEAQVSWRENGKGTMLTAVANIKGAVAKADIQVREYTIPLSAASNSEVFQGSVAIASSPKELFKVVTLPVLRVEASNGAVITVPVKWDKIITVSPTPIEKYTHSKSSLESITNIFAVQKYIYLSIFLFVALALLLNIFIEVHKQHPHVIGQTMALLVLIAVLIVV